jgi:hypothetical protein
MVYFCWLVIQISFLCTEESGVLNNVARTVWSIQQAGCRLNKRGTVVRYLVGERDFSECPD